MVVAQGKLGLPGHLGDAFRTMDRIRDKGYLIQFNWAAPLVSEKQVTNVARGVHSSPFRWLVSFLVTWSQQIKENMTAIH